MRSWGIHFVAARTERAGTAQSALVEEYGQTAVGECDVIVALGGDGHMLDTLRIAAAFKKPVYGMNLGTVGFLMNDFQQEGLLSRLNDTRGTEIHPIRMNAFDAEGNVHTHIAWNEVTVFRQSGQAIKLQVDVDGVTRIPELVCDGIMLATPLGSTAYNLSAGGPVIPLESRSFALTPIAPFRPRRWRGAILPDSVPVDFIARDTVKRPMSATADSMEVRNVVRVEMEQDLSNTVTILHDLDHNLSERLMSEQFEF